MHGQYLKKKITIHFLSKYFDVIDFYMIDGLANIVFTIFFTIWFLIFLSQFTHTGFGPMPNYYKDNLYACIGMKTGMILFYPIQTLGW